MVPATAQQRRISLPARYALAATLRALDMKSAGRGRVTAAGAWRTSRTPDGPGTIRLERTGPEITATAWGRGGGWLLETVPGLLGLDDDPEAFQPGPGVVRDLHRRSPGLRLGRTLQPFEVAVAAILGQRVTSRQARTGYRRLVEVLGEPAPGPGGFRLPPAPDRLAAMAYEDFHRFGVERARAEKLVEAARRAKRIDEIVSMPKKAAWDRLLAIRGIGPWTAAAIMGIARGDADAVPVGDYHIPNMVAWALAGEPRGDDARMLELLTPYQGQRRRVLLLLKNAGIGAPKYGPRSAITPIERI